MSRYGNYKTEILSDENAALLDIYMRFYKLDPHYRYIYFDTISFASFRVLYYSRSIIKEIKNRIKKLTK